MTDYASDDRILAVAQSCRNFYSKSKASGRFTGSTDGVTCRICRNWDGRQCFANAFDNVLNRLDN